jgi:hypothetical protein
MKTKTIYWIVGIAAVVGAGYYIWKKNKSEGVLNVESVNKKCYGTPLPNDPSCSEWKLVKKSGNCVWECQDHMKPPKENKPSF